MVSSSVPQIKLQKNAKALKKRETGIVPVDVFVQQRVEVQRVKNVSTEQEVTREPRLRLAVTVGAPPAFGRSFEGNAHRIAPLRHPLRGRTRGAAREMEAIFSGGGEALGWGRLLRQAAEVRAEFLRDGSLFVQRHFNHFPLDIQSLT